MNELLNILNSIHKQTGINVNADAVSNLMDKATAISFAKGELIPTADEYGRGYIYYMIDGIARCCIIDKDGNDVTKFFNVEGQFLMAENIFMENIDMQIFEALENCRMLRAYAYDIKAAIDEEPSFAEIYVRSLEQAVSYKIFRENSLMMQTAAERYISFKAHYPSLEVRVPQYCIASYLNITPESLSRIRRAIKDN